MVRHKIFKVRLAILGRFTLRINTEYIWKVKWSHE